MLKSPRTLSLSAAIVAVAAVALAQQAGERVQDPPRRTERAPAAQPRETAPARQDAQSNPTERFLITCLINKNQGEVAQARIAQQQSQNQQVKEFAAMMIKDHSQMIQKLQQLAGGSAGATGAAEQGGAEQGGAEQEQPGREPATRRPAGEGNQGTQGNQPGRRTAGNSGQSSPIDTLIQIDNEIAQRCLASARRELESREGAEFDQAYMGMQVVAHMKMADELSVLRNHTSSQLKEIVSQGLETTQEHLAHAKKILESLPGEGAATARRPRTPATERQQ